jgi:hypothetical protein
MLMLLMDVGRYSGRRTPAAKRTLLDFDAIALGTNREMETGSVCEPAPVGDEFC